MNTPEQEIGIPTSQCDNCKKRFRGELFDLIAKDELKPVIEHKEGGGAATLYFCDECYKANWEKWRRGIEERFGIKMP